MSTALASAWRIWPERLIVASARWLGLSRPSWVRISKGCSKCRDRRSNLLSTESRRAAVTLISWPWRSIRIRHLLVFTAGHAGAHSIARTGHAREKNRLTQRAGGGKGQVRWEEHKCEIQARMSRTEAGV